MLGLSPDLRNVLRRRSPLDTSYLYARRLFAAGTEASYYQHGILGWCRAGLPLESGDCQATNAVHPYWRVFDVPDHYEVRI